MKEYHGQNGEDAILDRYFEKAGISHGYFVEFGAWDGKFLSNCYYFFKTLGWKGCYIEGDPSRFEDLQNNFRGTDLDLLNAFVTPNGPKSLDALLKSVNAPQDLDLLSIDIDSDDHAIWEGLHQFQPKVVIIEYNPTIPNACEFVQPLGANIGNSGLSLKLLAEKKGYALCAATKTNLIFIRADELDLFGEAPRTLDEVRPDRGHIFYGYDGTVRTTGVLDKNPWTQAPLDEAATVHKPSWRKTRKAVSRAIRAPLRRLRGRKR